MVTWCVVMCPGAGPLIETITVKFKTRADCGDWHDKISGQIRAARQSAVLPSKLSLQPVPPPHVSNCFLLDFTFLFYRVPQKYRLKVYGSEGHKNGANHIIFLCMFFSTSGHLV